MRSDEHPREFLTAQQVGDWLGVPIHTVTREARLGRLPARKVGKAWRFSRTALLAFFHSPTSSAFPQPAQARDAKDMHDPATAPSE